MNKEIILKTFLDKKCNQQKGYFLEYMAVIPGNPFQAEIIIRNPFSGKKICLRESEKIPEKFIFSLPEGYALEINRITN